ncbi:2-oxo acid dehydrogenase subunit E2 [Solirubrobacter phytolaccae]|uniref:Dihydrolipoamide acetyltransferase component of pyruvate dehydrogenase complex n=1 Tax=Solirubrobacter phytolaccae TaxID=1404360 RepID=A0A9X3SBW6_9ACTN|nr:dihydrolipoamide acetyltransferase family protein [Solirubrobacter phytolaccae]MDA0181865.1 2-oxo acid dehydrogenase subunit E2 [Solirubrobacter phytolaccae]
MPQMGVSVAEGTVVEWKKQVGDWVEADEIICSISTDKIDTDVESPATGRVAEIIVAVGDTVDVGVVMAKIATDAKPGEAHASENGVGTGEAAAALEAPGEAGELIGDATDRSQAKRYSPVVMRMAAEHNLDLSQIQGSGRGGRISKKDVLAFLENGGGAEEPPMHIESPYRPDEPAIKRKPKPRLQRVEEVPAQAAAAPAPAAAAAPAGAQPLSRMRQAIGSRMVESLQTAATCTTIAEADMSRIEAARAASKLSYLPFQARATIETLLEFPQLNATLEDGQHTVYNDAVHLGIAVSLGSGGLIVPIIRDAQDLSVEGLAKRIKDIAVRARNNQLKPDEVSGGTFTITNPGGYGSIMATPVINLPQVGILDTEAVVKRPVVITDELGNDSIAIRSMTYLCMSWDHRALDGAYAAQFLSALRKKLEAWPIS